MGKYQDSDKKSDKLLNRAVAKTFKLGLRADRWLGDPLRNRSSASASCFSCWPAPPARIRFTVALAISVAVQISLVVICAVAARNRCTASATRRNCTFCEEDTCRRGWVETMIGGSYIRAPPPSLLGLSRLESCSWLILRGRRDRASREETPTANGRRAAGEQAARTA